jgi:hypothetical protein
MGFSNDEIKKMIFNSMPTHIKKIDANKPESIA